MVAGKSAISTVGLGYGLNYRGYSIDELADGLEINARQCLKTLIAEADDGGLVALVLRGDHELNALKAERLEGIASPLRLAAREKIAETLGSDIGSIGPIGLAIPIYVDNGAAALGDFVCGANQNDKHLVNANWGRDCDEPTAADIRNVVDGDPSPDGNGRLGILRGIEVGHIFQLGQKYSESMHASVLDDQGKQVAPFMGCYGIGVTRVVAAAIEQNHDQRGIIWPQTLAPFQLAICPINYHKSEQVRQVVDSFYDECLERGIEVLLDDRAMRPGVMFSDMELIGLPHRIVFSERGIAAQQFEYKGRCDESARDIALAELSDFAAELCPGSCASG